MLNRLPGGAAAPSRRRSFHGGPGPGSASRALHRVAVMALVLLGAGLAAVVPAQTITEFPVPTAGSEPNGIAAGPDGNLWFTEAGANKIGRITTAGVVTEFVIPTQNSGASYIAAGPDGNLWFTEVDANKIGRITTGGVVSEFDVPTLASEPEHIIAGPDGNVWFTEFAGNKIGQITPGGIVTEFTVPTANSGPDDITVGPDGALWFTEFDGNKIGRITTAGAITEFPLLTAGSQPSGIAAGPDGALWFTEFAGNKVGRITTGGTITEYPIALASSTPLHIEAGPDGRLWFAQPGLPGPNARLAARGAAAALATNHVGRATTAGVVTEFTVPTPNSQPVDVAAGPDGNLWFTEFDGNKIGRVDLAVGITAINANNGPSAGGTPVNITGTNFQDVPTVTIGGTPATGVTFQNPGQVDATTPALPPGTLNTVILTNPDASTATLTEGWLSDFSDTPQAHLFHDFIEKIFRAHITAGCGGGNYCPGNPITRAQMAVFLLKGRHGPGFTPPPATGTVFDDVSAGSFAAAWIEQLFAEGITAGCDPDSYCPNQAVTRAQMAVFLLKAKYGSGYTPPPATGTVFDDVSAGSFAAAWIEQLFAEAITAGCDPNNYCPNSPNTRGQMAVFISKTFGLP